jgi:hypothetical protein
MLIWYISCQNRKIISKYIFFFSFFFSEQNNTIQNKHHWRMNECISKKIDFEFFFLILKQK